MEEDTERDLQVDRSHDHGAVRTKVKRPHAPHRYESFMVTGRDSSEVAVNGRPCIAVAPKGKTMEFIVAGSPARGEQPSSAMRCVAKAKADRRIAWPVLPNQAASVEFWFYHERPSPATAFAPAERFTIPIPWRGFAVVLRDPKAGAESPNPCGAGKAAKLNGDNMLR